MYFKVVICVDRGFQMAFEFEQRVVFVFVMSPGKGFDGVALVYRGGNHGINLAEVDGFVDAVQRDAERAFVEDRPFESIKATTVRDDAGMGIENEFA